LPDFIVARKVDRILEPLAKHHLQPNLTIDLNVAEEVNNILGAHEGEPGEDQDKGLDERGCLSSFQTRGNSLEKLRQERAKPLVTGLLDQFSGQAANLRRGSVLNARPEKTVDDPEAHLKARPAVLVVPAEHLLMVVHEDVLNGLGAGTQNVALRGGHQEVVELGQNSGNKTFGQWLGTVLNEEGQKVGGQL
jgi:hypothetical protein